MIPNLGFFLVAFPIEDNQIRVLLRHVAIDAVAVGLVMHFRKSIGSRFVAAQTTLGERREIVLSGVNIVTSEAGHRGRLEAPAPFKQVDLVAMHVDLRVWIGARKLNGLLEYFAWKIGEGGSDRDAMALVAPGAEIHLSVARKAGRVQDGGVSRNRSFDAFSQHMLTSRPMTFFAGDAHHKPGPT